MPRSLLPVLATLVAGGCGRVVFDETDALETSTAAGPVVDVGEPSGDAPWLRARILTPGGVLRVTSAAPPPADGAAASHVAALVSSDRDALLVAFADEGPGGETRQRVIRATCLPE